MVITSNELNADLILNKVMTEEDFGTEGRQSSPRHKKVTKDLQTSSLDVLESALDSIMAGKHEASKRGSHLSIRDDQLKIRSNLGNSEHQESFDADDNTLHTIFKHDLATTISQVQTLTNSPKLK